MKNLNKRKCIIATLITGLLGINIYIAQGQFSPPLKQWQHTSFSSYNSGADSSEDWVWNIAQTSDGNYIGCGFTQRPANPDKTIPSMIKLNASGQVIWERFYDNGQPDLTGVFLEVIETPTHYVAIGHKQDIIGNFRIFFVQVSKVNGFLFRTKHISIPGVTQSFASSIQQTPDGGFIICGSANNNQHMLLLKLNAAGGRIFHKFFGRTFGNNEATTVRLTHAADGTADGFILTGLSENNAVPRNNDVHVVRTNLNGDLIWQRFYNSTALKASGDYVDVDAALDVLSREVEYNGDPNFCFDPDEPNPPPDPTSDDIGAAVEEISPGGDFIIGAKFDFFDCFALFNYVDGPTQVSYRDMDAVLMKVSRTGTLLFAKNIAHFKGIDFRTSVKVTSDGGFVVLGSTVEFDRNKSFLVKTDALGNVIWERAYTDSNFQNCALGFDLTDDDGFVISGNNELNGDDYLVMKLFSDCNVFFNIDGDFTINAGDNIIWDNLNFKVKGQVIIKGGGKLTIKNGSLIEFADTRRINFFSDVITQRVSITVERGGVLEIDNSTLTSLRECYGSMWDGIQVWGDAALPHPTLSEALSGNSPNHGVVILKNGAIIEHAQDAIRLVKTGDGFLVLDHTGGIVIAENSTFRNNRRVVEFIRYLHPNISSFTQCTFETDGILNDPNTKPSAFVSMWDVHGVIFEGNTFINRTPDEFAIIERGTGILSIDASYKVVEKCLAVGPTGCVSNVPNTFENLFEGIHALGNGQVNANIIVTDNIFNNVYRGICSAGQSFDRIEGNTFVNVPIGSSSLPSSFGINMFGSQGFTVHNNQITGTLNIMNYGINVQDAEGGRVINNDIDNVFTSLQAAGFNAFLEFSCNKLSNFIIGLSGAGTGIIADGDLATQGNGCGIHNGFESNEFLTHCIKGSGKTQIGFDIISTFPFDYKENPTNPNPASGGCMGGQVVFDDCSSEPDPSSFDCLISFPDCEGAACIGTYKKLIAQASSPAEKGILFAELMQKLDESDKQNLMQSLLTAQQTVQANKILVPTFISDKKFQRAESTLNRIPEDNLENIQFHKFYNTSIDVHSSGRTFFDMTPAEETIVREVAATGTSVALHAQKELTLVFEEKFPHEPARVHPDSFLTIKGTLRESLGCDGNVVAGDTIVLIDDSSKIVQGITPAVTDSTGRFFFDISELLQLDTARLYALETKSSQTSLETVEFKTLVEWLQQSPVELTLAGVREEWVEKFSSPVPISQFATAIDVNGNVYITGFSLDPAERQNFITIKYNSDGVQQWMREHNGPFNHDDIALSIAINENCDVYVCGYSVKDSTVGFELLTIKYDSLGNEIWTDRFNIGGLTAFLNPANIILDNDENPIVIGTLEGPTSDRDFVTIKYDPATGSRQWVAVFNGPGNRNDFGEVIAVDASNNVYVQGYSDQGGSQFNITSIKYNAAGVQQWIASFNANNVGYLNPIGTGRLDTKHKSLSNDGGFYVTGYSNVGVTDIDFVTIKYDASTGNQLWSQTFDGPANGTDIPSGLVVDESSNVYVGGGSQGIGTGEDYTTIKYDPSGDLQWVAGYNSPINALDRLVAMDIDNTNNIYVTGTSLIGIANTEIVTIKYDSDGNQQWLINYDSPDNVAGNQFEGASDLAVTNTGNVYVIGGSDGSQFSPGFLGFKFVTIKYSQCPTPITTFLKGEKQFKNSSGGKNKSGEDAPANEVEDISLNKKITIYPNPFSNTTTIIINNYNSNKSYTFVMYDLLGREMKRIEDIERNQFTVEKGKLKRGMYFFQVKTNDNNIIGNGKFVIR